MIETSKYKVLLVDDDPHVLRGLEILLSDDYSMISASSGKQAIESVKSEPDVGVIVMDIKMPEMDGIEAARAIKSLAPDIPVIFHTGYPGEYLEDDIDKSENPYGYIRKGGPASRLTRAISNAMDAFVAKKQIAMVALDAERQLGMVGKSLAMTNIYRMIHKVAPSESKIMILGETGTGKELVARAIHVHSSRCDHPLVIFNCNHKSPDLVESELFGHGKGAFTGAVSDNVGLFEYGDGGTVFLDEIGDLDITTQAKVLRVLETGEFQTLGRSAEIKKTDVRIVCATHHDLEGMVAEGRFREDLFYRLKGIIINMPPLRERREDIPLLVKRFSDQMTIEKDQLPKHFDQSAMQALIEYNWPGNVRQLQDTVESLIVLTDSYLITGDDVNDFLGNGALSEIDGGAQSSLADRVKEFRRNCIIEALHETSNNVNAAARLLQVDPANLRKWIKGYGINQGC